MKGKGRFLILNLAVRKERTPTVAVAFGGGGARGLAHIHAIEALDELGVSPVAIAGSSIGAIMGAGMASGLAGSEIREYCLSVLGRRSEVARLVWRARPTSIAEVMSNGLQVGQFNIERILRSFLPDAVPERFEDLRTPLKVTATDFFGHELRIFAEGELHSALAASAAIPAVFRPVSRDGHLFIDGGIYNPVPFDLLAGAADITIAIDVVGAPFEQNGKAPTSIDLIFGATQLMMRSITAAKLEHTRPDILLKPPVSRFRALDFLKIEEVLAETAELKEDLKRALSSLIEMRLRS